MKKISVFLTTALLAACLLALLAGCSGSQAVTLEGQERDTVLAKAEPITDALLKGMNDHDFAAFSRDFDEGMKKAMTEERFNQMMSTLDGKIGKYQSRNVVRVEKVGTHYAVIYLAKYEQEESVSWRVVLTQADPPQVSGLWYDSPKLRGK